MAEGLAANIVHAGNPVLRQEAEDVPASMLGTDELRSTVQLMIDTMRAAPGVGLAAPQIGVPLKARNTDGML
jgi:peptide deformylase